MNLGLSSGKSGLERGRVDGLSLSGSPVDTTPGAGIILLENSKIL